MMKGKKNAAAMLSVATTVWTLDHHVRSLPALHIGHLRIKVVDESVGEKRL